MNSGVPSTSTTRLPLKASIVKLCLLITSALGNVIAAPLISSNTSDQIWTSSRHHEPEEPRTTGQLVLDCLSIAVSHDHHTQMFIVHPLMFSYPSFPPPFLGPCLGRWSLCWSDVSCLMFSFFFHLSMMPDRILCLVEFSTVLVLWVLTRSIYKFYHRPDPNQKRRMHPRYCACLKEEDIGSSSFFSCPMSLVSFRIPF